MFCVFFVLVFFCVRLLFKSFVVLVYVLFVVSFVCFFLFFFVFVCAVVSFVVWCCFSALRDVFVFHRALLRKYASARASVFHTSTLLLFRTKTHKFSMFKNST